MISAFYKEQRQSPQASPSRTRSQSLTLEHAVFQGGASASGSAGCHGSPASLNLSSRVGASSFYEGALPLPYSAHLWRGHPSRAGLVLAGDLELSLIFRNGVC